jgi:hypothetical protein
MTDQPPWWHSPDEPGPESVGSAAEEAARLFTALRDRLLSDPATLRAGMKMVETFSALRGTAASAAAGGVPGSAPECAFCPFCQAVARAKTFSPDTVEQLTAAAMEFADSVRKIMTPPAEDADDVRHVPLDDDFEDWPEPQEARPTAPGSESSSASGAEQENPAEDQ